MLTFTKNIILCDFYVKYSEIGVLCDFSKKGPFYVEKYFLCDHIKILSLVIIFPISPGLHRARGQVASRPRRRRPDRRPHPRLLRRHRPSPVGRVRRQGTRAGHCGHRRDRHQRLEEEHGVQVSALAFSGGAGRHAHVRS